MAKVTGIGGVFFKSRDPKTLSAWYRDKLGVDVTAWGGAKFSWREEPGGCTVWTPFAEDTTHFQPSDKPYMVNFRVDDLEGLLAKLRAAGEKVLDRGESGAYGRFGYVLDPEGTLLELWEPPPDVPASAG